MPRLLLSCLTTLLILAGCGNDLKTKEKVQAAIVERLQDHSGLDLKSMDVTTTGVTFENNLAYATVAFHPKGVLSVNGGMSMKYTLEARNGKWVVTKVGDSNGHSLAPTPPGSGNLPSGHPPVDPAAAPMKTIAVLGGGPAGATAAERLARSGLRTIILDEKLAWEKPCGGGITYKAYSQYPYLLENDTPKKVVTDTMLAAPKSGAYKMQLTKPLLIYSRMDLNQMLLNRAEAAGAEIEQERVLGLERGSNQWKIRTRSGTIDADYCVVATGARNPLRAVGTQYTAQDTMYALGYWVPTNQAHIDIQFLPNLEGYIWVFPRAGHLSVGICGKGESAQCLRARLERYMDEKAIPRRDAKFYGHMLPALESHGWRNNRLAGDGWIAVGDAGGLVDPITGEGLYYAIRSGDLASQVLLNGFSPEKNAEAYRQYITRDFGLDLTYGAGLAKRLFCGAVCFGAVPSRMIDFMKRSPRFCEIMQDLFAGTQPYLELKSRLLRNVNSTLHEILMSFLFRKILLGETRV